MLHSRKIKVLNDASFVDFMDDKAFRSVERHLIRISQGVAHDVESQLLPDTDSKHKQLFSLDIIDGLTREGKYPWLENLEMDELTKIRPYSRAAPFSKVGKGYKASFFSAKEIKLKTDLQREATRRVKTLLRPRGLRRCSFNKVLDLTNLKTQWALPFWTSRPDEDQIKAYQDLAESDLANMEITRFPCTVGVRMQITKEGQDLKQRLVWIYPHHIVLLESLYAIPLMQSLREHLFEFSSQAGPDSTDKAVDVVFEYAKTQNLDIICLDFPEFDQKIGRPIIEEVFDCISYWFADDDGMLDLLKENFATSDLLTPEGIWTGRDGGIPSGSAFTSVVGTIAHIWIKEYVKVKAGIDLSVGKSLHAGDDGIWCIPGLDISDIESAFKDLNINFVKEKFLVSKDRAVFLQRHFERNYTRNGRVVGVRVFTRAFASMCYHERPVNKATWNKYLESVRWIAQLENLKYHPYFKDIVLAIAKLDRLGLGVNLPGGVLNLFKLAGGSDYIKEQLGSFMWLPNQAFGKVTTSDLAVVNQLAELVQSGELSVNRDMATDVEI